MAHRVDAIAQALGARFEGDGTLTVSGASEPSSAKAGQIALAMDPKYAAGLAKGEARVAMLWEDADFSAFDLDAAIFVPRPRLAMAGLSKVFDPGPEIAPGIHPSAVIDPSAEIGEGAAIGPFTYIGRGVKIGAQARISAQVFIAEGVQIGDDALIHSGARIMSYVRIGDRFICNPNAVLGGDGFSFVTPEKSGVEEIRNTVGKREEIHAQHWTRIHSLGTVIIGDDVEIGANATVDRGTVRATKIGNGTKLDNLVCVGHNVQIGDDCMMCGQVGIAGSVKIGNRVVLGGQTGVSDNIFIGDDVIAGGSTKIFTNAPAGRVLLGSPAVKMETQVEIQKSIRRLPRLFAQFADLRKTVAELRDNKGTE
ncbi:UDP-3-O-(3-hydroxymyristoyl)glucosamine N-acyltransferase [Thioclava sp. 'Guangxiensis']|uniref:UDP-3-O-(3-hydroxymyristoyl)glucosamine N-acyltransferase n=1 Tax=Thioclava sp. 'Guangxiensis' TaxID=3149044 RepID=UPI003877CB31